MLKNTKKRLLSLIMTFTIAFGITSIPAHAEWKQNNNNQWNYINLDGTLKTGWFKDNDNWYYFNKNGNMMTGWIIDNGTWYYMREDGSLNNSKTTGIIPSEIKSTIDIIKPFAGNLSLKYAGIGYIKDTDGFSSYGLANKRILIFKAEDEYGNDADFYYVYDPYNCKIFKLFDNLTIKYLGQANTTNSISQEQAKLHVTNYLIDNKKYIPGIIEIEASNDNNNVFTVHCYDNMGDHTATYGWYYIDKSTGEIIEM